MSKTLRNMVFRPHQKVSAQLNRYSPKIIQDGWFSLGGVVQIDTLYFLGLAELAFDDFTLIGWAVSIVPVAIGPRLGLLSIQLLTDGVESVL